MAFANENKRWEAEGEWEDVNGRKVKAWNKIKIKDKNPEKTEIEIDKLEACGEEKGTSWRQKPQSSSSISKENGGEVKSLKTSHQPRGDRKR